MKEPKFSVWQCDTCPNCGADCWTRDHDLDANALACWSCGHVWWIVDDELAGYFEANGDKALDHAQDTREAPEGYRRAEEGSCSTSA